MTDPDTWTALVATARGRDKEYPQILVYPFEAFALPEHVRCRLVIPLPRRRGLVPTAGEYILDQDCEIRLCPISVWLDGMPIRTGSPSPRRHLLAVAITFLAQHSSDILNLQFH